MNKHLENLKTVLQALDCTDTQVEVFITIFRSLGLTASQISERTGIERNKCYRILEDLSQRNIIKQMANKKVNTFSTICANELNLLLEKQITARQEAATEFKTSIASLNSINKTNENKTKITYYQKKSIHKLLENILTKKNYQGIFNPGTMFEKYPETLKAWLKTQETSTQKIRELVPVSSIKFYSVAKKIANPNYNIRMMDANIKFNADFILYEDKIYLASYRSNVALIIEDHNLFESFSSLFDSLWKNT